MFHTYATASRCHWLVDQCPGQVPPRQRPSQNGWLVQEMMSLLQFPHRSSSNPMILCEMEHSVVWNRTRGSGRVLWWWRSYLLVAGACSGELYCGGARWLMVTASYGDSYNSIRCAGDSVSHLGASKVIAGVIHRRRWPQPRRFWRACCKGKWQKSIDWDLPPFNSTLRETLGVEAELQGLTGRPRVT
jgi:hypothetical protein